MKRIRIDLDDAMHARLNAWAKAYGADRGTEVLRGHKTIVAALSAVERSQAISSLERFGG